jgi:putative transposase
MKTLDFTDKRELKQLTDLEKADCKTGHRQAMGGGRIYRSWSGGRCRILGGEGTDYCYHVMSRTCGGDFLFGTEDKEAFKKIMRRMARFSGVKILTYCVMDNHFHILTRVPAKEKFLSQFDDQPHETEGSGEERLMQHLSILYSESYVTRVRAELAWMREHQMEDDVEKFLQKYKHRFCNLSLFVKELKERFSRWFNKKHERRGTLWMDRFKSVLVEDGEALQTMATYIDLNPVRAGLVEDPKDYRWCGYAEAVGGSKQARRGLCQVMGKPMDSWLDSKHESGALYRCWLMIAGGEVVGNCEVPGKDENNGANMSAAVKVKTKEKKGIPRSIMEKKLERAGLFSGNAFLKEKVQAFSEGLAFGSENFVNGQYKKHRSQFSPNRKTGARSVVLSNDISTAPLTDDASQASKGLPTQKYETATQASVDKQDDRRFYTLFRGKESG